MGTEARHALINQLHQAATISEILDDAPTGEASVDEILQDVLGSIRDHLGMQVAFVSEFLDGRRFFRYVDTTLEKPPIGVGASDPLDESYCQLTTLQDALAELAHSRAELLTAIGGLGEGVLDRKGLIGDWSIKNVLAHIAAWEAWVVQVLPARMTTATTPEDFRQRAQDEDRFNAEEVAEREELTPDEQLMELERTRAELLAYLRGLDEDALARTQPWDTWAGTLPEYLIEALRDHEAEHVELLRVAVAGLVR